MIDAKMKRAIAEFYARVQGNIDRVGWSVLNVGGDWSYTIGLPLKALPELILFGRLHPESVQGIINIVAQAMVDRGQAFSDGQILDLFTAPVAIVACDPAVKVDHTIQATRFLERDDYDVMQVVLCDPQHRFPWDAGCDENYRVKVWRSLQS